MTIQVQQRAMDLFPIPVSVGTLGEQSRGLNERLIEDTWRAMEEMPIEERTGIGIRQTMSYMEKNYQSFKDLATIITEYSKPFIKATGTHNTDINAEWFWVNVNQNPSAFHMPHGHQLDGYMWTGVYFPTSGILNGKNIEDDEDLDVMTNIESRSQPHPGDLTFLDPLQCTKTGAATKRTDRYPYWGNPMCITPKAGTIVMFPTYLGHLVTPTEKENLTRISIAFYVRVHNGDGGIDFG